MRVRRDADPVDRGEQSLERPNAAVARHEVLHRRFPLAAQQRAEREEELDLRERESEVSKGSTDGKHGKARNVGRRGER